MTWNYPTFLTTSTTSPPSLSTTKSGPRGILATVFMRLKAFRAFF